MAAHMDRPIVVIGGGAAGMVAALTAQAGGGSVVLIEKGARLGRKLAATGNGRCNMSNKAMGPQYYGGEGAARILKHALKAYPLQGMRDFFAGLGLETIFASDGKLYPRSLQAGAVLDVLRLALAEAGVAVYLEEEVTRLAQQPAGWLVQTTQRQLQASQVIVAVGGAAAPQLGGSEAGYDLLTRLGHQCGALLPGIVQLKSPMGGYGNLKGQKIDAAVQLLGREEIIATASGEVLFTDYGLSGPPILYISNAAARRLAGGVAVTVRLDLAPDLSSDLVYALLMERLSSLAVRPLEYYLVGFLPKQIGLALYKHLNLGKLSRTVASLALAEVEALAGAIKGWDFVITGSKGWADAQVTIGGIGLADFVPETLASRCAPGLYACGEVLDVDGLCGGYNLQWAFSSGRLAGASAAQAWAASFASRSEA